MLSGGSAGDDRGAGADAGTGAGAIAVDLRLLLYTPMTTCMDCT